MTVQSAQANNRARSAELFERARRVLVGGGQQPRPRVSRGRGAAGLRRPLPRGATIHDVDGNRYVDLVGTWGPAIVGHAHPQVVAAVSAGGGQGP